MPSLLWLSFQFPFVLVHFHGSITRPIIIFSFYLFFFIATQDKKKKRPLVTSHLVYGRLLTLLIRMLFSEPTCQWHTIKPAFQIRTFMAMEMFLTNGNIQMWADCLSERQEVFKSESCNHCFFLKVCIIDLENEACSWILWKSNRSSKLQVVIVKNNRKSGLEQTVLMFELDCGMIMLPLSWKTLKC